MYRVCRPLKREQSAVYVFRVRQAAQDQRVTQPAIESYADVPPGSARWIALVWGSVVLVSTETIPPIVPWTATGQDQVFVTGATAPVFAIWP